MTNKSWKLMETIKRLHKKPSNMKFMGGALETPLNHQRYEKPRTSRGLNMYINNISINTLQAFEISEHDIKRSRHINQ